MFSVLFSEKILNQKIGLDSTGTNPKSNMCTEGNMNKKLENITQGLYNSTNYLNARRQMQFMEKYRDALQMDTSRYGEPGYECLVAPHTKEEFFANKTNGNKFGSGFFPGMCDEARENALSAARTQMCERQICNIGEVVDQSSIRAENGLIDWDSLDYDVSGSLSIPKPDIEWESNKVKGAWNWVTGQEEKMAKFDWEENHEITKDDVDVDIDEDSLKRGDATAHYGFVNMSFCDMHIVPCPDFSKYDELTDVVEDYAKEKLQLAYDHSVEFAAPAIQEVNMVVDESMTALAELLIYQMEIASYIYVVYTCLTLFFPSPLVIFREHFLIALRQFVFGASKYTFILLCLAIWWGVQYFETFQIYTEFSIYMKIFFQDPCVGNFAYIKDIFGNFSSVCKDMVELNANWTIENRTIFNILDLIDPMTTCCEISYPYESLKDIMPDASMEEIYESYGFLLDPTEDNICGAADTCFLPDINSTFVGDMTTCEDNSFVRTQILNLLDNTANINWWDIWISTGLLASIILKGCVANFGIALVQLADPFMQCDGKYVGPPRNFNFGQKEMAKLIAKCDHLLKNQAVGKVFFWGVFMNLLMLNIILGTERENDFEEPVDPAKQKKDAIVGGFLIFLSMIPVGIGVYAHHLVKRKYFYLLKKAGSRQEESEYYYDGESSSSYYASSEYYDESDSESESVGDSSTDLEAAEPPSDDEESISSTKK